MKEFTSQVGGRHTYIDDILNLQELSLAVTSLFDGCDNFIMSGCQISGNSISSGYVYINGKIRYCAGTSGISSWPIYIYERNTVEKVSYADSGDKVGRNVYGCAIGTQPPVSADSLTGAVPQFIQVMADGSAMKLKDAFFGKYALAIDSAFDSQHVKKNMTLGGKFTADGVIQSNEGFQTVKGNSKGTISFNPQGGDLIMESSQAGRNAYKIVIENSGKFQFYSGDDLLATISDSGFVASVSFSAASLNTGNVCCTSSDVYNKGTSTDEGELKLNMVGHNGGHTYYRNTLIGDGKGKAVLTITGKNHACRISGDLFISSSNTAALNIGHATLVKTDKTLQSVINWQDKNNEAIATVGYSSSTDYNFYIHNNLGDVCVDGNLSVSGNLSINGIDAMSTFVSKENMKAELKKKADESNVYSKESADNAFIKRTDSIGVFVNHAGGGEAGKKSVRNSIGAAATSDVNKMVQKSQLFKDIVSEGLPNASDENYATSLANRHRALCANIGAVYKGDAQLAPKDTGWMLVNMGNCSITTLHVRQIGHIVCIQGELHTHHSGVVFTLPNSIDPPKYKVGFSCYKNGEWTCHIAGGSRDCVVDTCNNGCTQYIGFLMTYIV